MPFEFELTDLMPADAEPSVTSRADAVVAAAVRDSAERSRLVEQVEATLVGHFVDGASVRVPLDGVPSHLRKSVADEYRAAGWQVDLTDNQHGAYMTLQ